MPISVTAFRRVWRKHGPYRTLLTIMIPGKPGQVVWLVEFYGYGKYRK